MTPKAIEESTFYFDNEYEAINRLYMEQGWTDGLPIMPPTERAVERMLTGTDRDRSEVLGKMPPNWAETTIEKVAVNAVMAGCLPEYLPVVLAAVEAILEPIFNLHAVQATTHGCGPMVVVNGPNIRKELNINCRYNCFGPGWQANASIGRTLRLVMTNVGGGTPGMLDRSTTGMPGKYAFCFGENEEESPWEPLHTDRGYGPQDNAVTVMPADGPHDILERSSTTALGIMTSLARSTGAIGSLNTLHFGQNALVIGPEHAETVAREGNTKQMVRQFIFENGGAPLSLYGPEVGPWRQAQLAAKGVHVSGDDRVPVAEKPEDIILIVAGGAGKHSSYIGVFGDSRAVSKPIRLP